MGQKRNFTEAFVARASAEDGKRTFHWDRGSKLVLKVMPKTGHKSYWTYYRVKGGTRWYRLDAYPGLTLKAARDAANDIRARVVRGGDPQAERAKSRGVGPGLKLAEAVDLYVDHMRPRLRAWRQAERALRRDVVPKLGHLPFAEVDVGRVSALHESLGAISESSADHTLAFLSAMMRWGVKRKIIPANVCRDVDKFPKRQPRTRRLDDDELVRFWRAAEAWPSLNASVALRLLLTTAARPTEVVHMRWRDLDFGEGWWALPGAAGEDGWGGTKNGRDHEVPLTNPTLKLLQLMGPRADGRVFGNLGRSTVTAAAARVAKKAGLKDALQARDLRRSVGTQLRRQLGVSREDVGKCLNHTGRRNVTDVYSPEDLFEMRGAKRAAFGLWAAKLDGLLGGNVVPLRRDLSA